MRFARLIRNLRSILVGMTIRVGCHAQNERAPTISSCVKSGGTVTRRWSTLVEFEVRACCGVVWRCSVHLNSLACSREIPLSPSTKLNGRPFT